MARTLEDRIRERAYFLWANNGGGNDGNHFWLMAEREVLAETELEALPAPACEPAATAVAADIVIAAPAAAIEEPATAAIAEAATPAPAPVAAPAAAIVKPKKVAARKRAAAKASGKSTAKPPVLTVVDSMPAKSATITPIRPTAKTSPKLAAMKARARAAAR